MSNTYSFYCHDCKESLWVGQSDYLYVTVDYVSFLHDHLGHKITFENDLGVDDELCDYKDVDEQYAKDSCG